MAQTIYTRTLPNLTRATRLAAYERLSSLFSHLPSFDGVDLLSLSIDPETLVVTVTLTNPLPDEQLEHLGLA
jgi:hypothetical protein